MKGIPRIDGNKPGDIPDEGVDLHAVNVVELLQRLLDLGLVRLDVDDEDEGVVLLNLLHGALGVERVDDDAVLIEADGVGDGLAGVLGGAGELEGLGLVEGGRGPDLALLLAVDLLGCQHRLRGKEEEKVGANWKTYTLEDGLGGGVGLLATYIVESISNRSGSELAKSAAA